MEAMGWGFVRFSSINSGGIKQGLTSRKDGGRILRV